MEEKKAQQPTKKVRFDLNEEIFLIPSKWDRLSKCKMARNVNVMDDLATKSKTGIPAAERRAKSKQNRNRKTQKVSLPSTSSSFPEPNTSCSEVKRPNTSPNVKLASGKRLRRDQESPDNARNSLSSTGGVKLRFSHRPPQDLPGVDLVLPKIPYSPVLKKAIEKALQRSRNKPKTESELNETCLQEHATADTKHAVVNFPPKQRTENVIARRLSDNGVEHGPELSNVSAKSGSSEQSSSKFSELSSNLGGWSPFSAWCSQETALQSTTTIKRVRSMSSIIPNSILY